MVCMGELYVCMYDVGGRYAMCGTYVCPPVSMVCVYVNMYVNTLFMYVCVVYVYIRTSGVLRYVCTHGCRV